MTSASFVRQATRFHGHFGPWLALGLRAGRHARRRLTANPFELRARVRCPHRTPHTCFLDGIQFGSGCTLGKGNISHVRSNEVTVEFRHGPGARLTLRLRPEVQADLRLLAGSSPARVTAAGRRIMRLPLRRLFLES